MDMMEYSNFLCHYGVTLKIAVYIFKWVPTKTIPKTSFELWKNLRHMFWGCPAEVNVHNPQDRKLDSTSITTYIIRYTDQGI